jgi:hypothetical protein
MNRVSPTVNGTFNTGRPSDLLSGMSQVVAFGAALPVKLEKSGIYNVVLALNGDEAKGIEFEALERAPAKNQ